MAKNNDEMVTTTIRLPEPLKQRLMIMSAKREIRNVNALIIELLEDFVRETNKGDCR